MTLAEAQGKIEAAFPSDAFISIGIGVRRHTYGDRETEYSIYVSLPSSKPGEGFHKMGADLAECVASVLMQSLTAAPIDAATIEVSRQIEELIAR